jgi:cyclin L
LSQAAWNYLNDSFRLDVCLRYSAQAIACAALYLSARKLGFPLPETADWLLVFGTSIDNVNKICEEVMHIYDVEKVKRSKEST